MPLTAKAVSFREAEAAMMKPPQGAVFVSEWLTHSMIKRYSNQLFPLSLSVSLSVPVSVSLSLSLQWHAHSD